jgi:DNA-directed RNA polymerase subunit omega
MNAELVKQALEKVGNPNVLVNMISRRVRQLNSGNGGACNPMVANTTNQGHADIALREIIEDKMGFEMPEIIQLKRPTARGRAKPQNWAKVHAVKNNGPS